MTNRNLRAGGIFLGKPLDKGLVEDVRASEPDIVPIVFDAADIVAILDVQLVSRAPGETVFCDDLARHDDASDGRPCPAQSRACDAPSAVGIGIGCERQEYAAGEQQCLQWREVLADEWCVFKDVKEFGNS